MFGHFGGKGLQLYQGDSKHSRAIPTCKALCGTRPFAPTRRRPVKPCLEGSQGQPCPHATRPLRKKPAAMLWFTTGWTLPDDLCGGSLSLASRSACVDRRCYLAPVCVHVGW